MWASLMFLGSVAGTPRLAAAPVITSLANAASNITFSSPFAQGVIFVIKGSGLGPENISVAPEPFRSTSLSGTSVAVTAGGATVNALMYYTSATQVAALLPSNTPTGAATVRVTYNGQTSNAVGRNVIARNLGIFTIDSSGQGPAIVTFPDYSLVSAARATPCGGPSTACGAANPGDTLILWATGLGPVSGDDATGAGLGQNMPNVPLTLWLGGVQAPIVYQGRSGCCVGEDQIVFTVPDNVPTGCAVPLVAQIGNAISNSTVMPVARGSRNCRPAVAEVDFLSLPSPVVAIADVGLIKRPNDNGVGYRDIAFFESYKVTAKAALAPFVASFLEYETETPPGTCIVQNSSNPSDDSVLVDGFAALDAGSSVTVQGPNGSVNIPAGDEVTISAAGTFLVPGAFTLSGSGGRDVGAFNTTLTVPALPMLVSPASASGLTVIRSEGMTVTWTGGDPNRNIRLSLSSSTDGTGRLSATAECTVPVSQGTFTIPPSVLLALPASNLSRFSLESADVRGPLTATGLTLGFFHYSGGGTCFGGFPLR
jgi:uncharacterized protein (TIGR03437 family)